MQSIGHPVLAANSPSASALTRGKAPDRALHIGLPSMPSFSDIAMNDDVQSPSYESMGALVEGLSAQDLSPIKGKQNE